MDAFQWQDDDAGALNLLPFGLDEALLPGETKQVHLFEARFLKLFEEAEAKHKGCVGQLLITPNGNVAAVTTLLEIEESRTQDVGVWARLRCVGRVRLKDVEQTDFGYARADVDLVTDRPSDPVGQDTLDACLEAHAACTTMERKLGRSGNSPSDLERVEWGHQENGKLSFGKGLDATRDARREMLCFRGLDSAPASGLDARMRRLWGASTEAEAEAMLLSFSAAAYLPPQERAMALLEEDTLERLQSATAFFREAQRRLAAELALSELSSDASSDGPSDANEEA